MDLQFFGANCLKVSSKKAAIVIDDNLTELGKSSITKPGDIRAFTGSAPEDTVEGSFVIAQPGEYEIADISVTGIAAQAHVDQPESRNATMYRITIDDVRLAIVGHIDPKLSEAQLESLGVIDVLVVPVGGSGFTLDGVGAQQVIKAIEPKIVIPTNYADAKLNYPVPAASLDDAIKALGMEPKETVAKLKIKPTDLMSDQPQLVILES